MEVFDFRPVFGSDLGLRKVRGRRLSAGIDQAAIVDRVISVVAGGFVSRSQSVGLDVRRYRFFDHGDWAASATLTTADQRVYYVAAVEAPSRSVRRVLVTLFRIDSLAPALVDVLTGRVESPTSAATLPSAGASASVEVAAVGAPPAADVERLTVDTDAAFEPPDGWGVARGGVPVRVVQPEIVLPEGGKWEIAPTWNPTVGGVRNIVDSNNARATGTVAAGAYPCVGYLKSASIDTSGRYRIAELPGYLYFDDDVVFDAGVAFAPSTLQLGDRLVTASTPLDQRSNTSPVCFLSEIGQQFLQLRLFSRFFMLSSSAGFFAPADGWSVTLNGSLATSFPLGTDPAVVGPPTRLLNPPRGVPVGGHLGSVAISGPVNLPARTRRYPMRLVAKDGSILAYFSAEFGETGVINPPNWDTTGPVPLWNVRAIDDLIPFSLHSRWSRMPPLIPPGYVSLRGSRVRGYDFASTPDNAKVEVITSGAIPFHPFNYEEPT
ncbi:MAG: hypothetical protein F4Y03_06240 [Alphaproteobacteria bacterium]|nr:hypothetical protein [Alphaproteobacteria bacterium]